MAAHRELLEAQLITACLEAATDKLHVLALIRADGEQSDLLKMRSDETGRMLEQHTTLMTQLKENIDTRRSPEIAFAHFHHCEVDEHSL